MARIKGFDTSRHNHAGDQPINFAKACANNFRFWAGRLTVANYYIDPWIERDFKAAANLPLIRIVYHVLKPEYDAASQVAKLQEGLALLDGKPDAIVIDVEKGREYGAKAVTNCLGEHVRLIREFYAGKIILYTNLDYLLHYILDTFGLDIWLSWPAAGGAFNPDPNPPMECILYQRSWSSEIPGVPDPTTDYDEWMLDEQAFIDYFSLGQEDQMDLTEILNKLDAITGLLIEIRDALLSEGSGPQTEKIVGYVVTIREPHANGYIKEGFNGVGKPIMVLPPQDQRKHYSGRIGYYQKLTKDEVNGDDAFYRVTLLTDTPVQYLHEKDVEEV